MIAVSFGQVAERKKFSSMQEDEIYRIEKGRRVREKIVKKKNSGLRERAARRAMATERQSES